MVTKNLIEVLNSLYVSTTASRGLLDKVHAEEFVSTLVSLSQPIAHLHDDVTRAVHYGCSSKDRESLKKNGGN